MPNDNIWTSGYVTFYYDVPSINIGSQNFAGESQDIFIVKYDNAGNVLWADVIGKDTKSENSKGLAVDGENNAFLMCDAQAYSTAAELALSFGNVTSSIADGTGYCIVAKYNAGEGASNDPPAAAFTNNLSGFTVTFTNTSTDATDYVWSFGDGTTSTQENPIHIYTQSGSQTVCLTASNECSSDTHCTTITIDPCTGSTLSINATGEATSCGADNGMATATATGGYPPYSYQWDNNAGNQTDTIATGLASGNYTVTVTDSEGCQATNTVNIADGNIVAGGTPTKLWDRSIGGTSHDYLYDILLADDGNYVLAGYTLSSVNGDKTAPRIGGYDYWLVKTDTSGNLIWDKTYGGTGHDQLIKIRSTADGGFVLGGYSSSGITGDKTETSRGSYDYWIVKIDANGNLQWEKTIGSDDTDYLKSVIQTSDGGYLLGGYTRSDTIMGDKSHAGYGNYDYWAVKLDANGNKVWDKTFGGTSHDYLWDAIELSNGTYMLAGYSSSLNNGNKSAPRIGGSDYWLVNVDVNGSKIWDKTIGGTGGDYLKEVIKDTDGNLLLGGYSASGANGNKSEASKGSYDYWLVKIDENANVIWDKTVGSTSVDYLEELELTTGGGYLLGGRSTGGIGADKTEPNVGSNDYWVVKLDANHDVEWDKTFGTTHSVDYLEGLAATPNNEYIIGGRVYNITDGDKTEPSEGGYDMWLIKMAAEMVAVSGTGDIDFDQVCDDNDNCTGEYNPNQMDTDGDGIGDECDTCMPDANGIIWITNTNDNGSGSLRAAIDCANNSTGANEIKFNLIGNAPFVIQLDTALPTLTDDETTINGLSQVNFYPGIIELDGSNITATAKGLVIRGNDCEVNGLYIHNFSSMGIYVDGAVGTGDGVNINNCVISNNTSEAGIKTYLVDGTIIENNFVGTDITGTSSESNKDGIRIKGGTNISILNNLVSGNIEKGIFVENASQSGNIYSSNNILVAYNLVGTDLLGINAIGNGDRGIGFNSLVNGQAKDNLVSGNTDGIYISNNSENISVTGNYVGTDINGTSAIANSTKGITVSTSTNIFVGEMGQGKENVVSGNAGSGIFVNSAANNVAVVNNICGLTFDGLNALGNGTYGIQCSNASDILIENNISSKNSTAGILVQGGANAVEIYSNKVGTDITGTIDMGNTNKGINISNATNITIGAIGRGNLVAGSGEGGIVMQSNSSNIVVQGNTSGCDISESNIIANDNYGINCYTSSNVLIGGENAGEGNVVVGNALSGIGVRGSSSNVEVYGNFIGTNSSESLDAGNVEHGINIEGSTNVIIGGVGAKENIIANNVSGGLRINANANLVTVGINQFECNEMIGIELESGGNNNIQKPTITNAYPGYVEGTGTAGESIYLYKSINANCSNNNVCQGTAFVDSTVIDASGNWLFAINLNIDEIVTAIATDALGNSSDFANCATIENPCDPINPTITLMGADTICIAGLTGIPSTTTLVCDSIAPTGFYYQWQKDSLDIAGATGQNYTAISSGEYAVYLIDSLNCSTLLSNSIEILEYCSGATPNWTVTNSNITHTVILTEPMNSNINGDTLEVGDYIGFFFNDGGILTCGGMTIWDGNQVPVLVYGDAAATPNIKEGFSQGESIMVKIWKASDQTIYGVDAFWLNIGSMNGIVTQTDIYTTNAISAIGSITVGSCNLEIALPLGWRIISSNCYPADSSIIGAFTPIENELIQVKDYQTTYMPTIGNTMGNWDITSGYLTKVNTTTALPILGGNPVEPLNTPFYLNSGWNLMGYILEGTSDPNQLFANILPNIVEVKTLTGTFIPGVVNTIGNMEPTQGYEIKLSQNDTLIQDPAVSTLLRPTGETVVIAEPVHFDRSSIISSTTATLVIYDKGLGILSENDEVGIFDMEDNLVGAVVYQNGNMGILIYGDDATTVEKDGMLNGEKYKVKVWYTALDKEVEVDLRYVEGDEFYSVNTIDYAEIISPETSINQYFGTDEVLLAPNPVSDVLNIQLNLLEQDDNVEISIYDVQGKLIKQIFNGPLSQGEHIKQFDTNGIVAGMYICNIKTSQATHKVKFTVL